MASHHLCDTSISCSQVQESLSPPVWADLEQLSELLRRKDKHGAATQKSKAESWIVLIYKIKLKKNYGAIDPLGSDKFFTHW